MLNVVQEYTYYLQQHTITQYNTFKHSLGGEKIPYNLRNNTFRVLRNVLGENDLIIIKEI